MSSYPRVLVHLIALQRLWELCLPDEDDSHREPGLGIQ